MKILVFATQHMQTGGIESHLQQFCEKMGRAGALIDLVILNSQMLPETRQFYERTCQRVFLGEQGRSYKRLFWMFSTAVRLRSDVYDSLYTNGQGNSARMFAKLVKYRKWVHHHHTAGDLADQSTWSKGYVKSLKIADYVVACANRNASDMATFLNREVKVIPCFSRQVTNLKGEIKPKETVRFGYFGRLIAEKGIEVICKLSQESDLSSVEFNLWGEGPAYDSAYFKKYPRINYHGTYNGIDGLNKVINYLDAYLLISSHGEGLPISLLEVMSAGLPWLATDKGGIRDIACDKLATRVIASPATYEDVKTAVLELADVIKEGVFTRTNQLELYRERYSADALVEQWSEIMSS